LSTINLKKCGWNLEVRVRTDNRNIDHHMGILFRYAVIFVVFKLPEEVFGAEKPARLPLQRGERKNGMERNYEEITKTVYA